MQTENPYDVVPHQDTVGHGTFLASIACGRGNEEYTSAAPEADIIAVKLKKAGSYYINRYPIPPGQENVFETTDVMLGIQYIIERATALNMPVVICIGLGTNQGGHDRV